MDDKTRAEVAQAMGMKPREIHDVQPADGGGYVVTTHDGARTLLDEQGNTELLAPGTPVVPAIPEDERCPTCGGSGRAPAGGAGESAPETKEPAQVPSSPSRGRRPAANNAS